MIIREILEGEKKKGRRKWRKRPEEEHSRTWDRMEDVISRITQSQSPEPVVVGRSIWLIKRARLFFLWVVIAIMPPVRAGQIYCSTLCDIPHVKRRRHTTLWAKREKRVSTGAALTASAEEGAFFFPFHSSILSVRGLIVKGNNLLSLLLSFFHYYFSTLLFLSPYLYCRFCSFLALFMLTKRGGGGAVVAGVNDVVTTTLSVRIPFRQRAIPKKEKKKRKKNGSSQHPFEATTVFCSTNPQVLSASPPPPRNPPPTMSKARIHAN